MKNIRICFSFILMTLVFIGPLPSGHAKAESFAVQNLDVASYDIQVSLNPAARTLEAVERITYTNITDEPVPDLVFHLYLNAFRDENTIFMRESGTQHRGFFFDNANPGWIEVSSIRIAGGAILELQMMEDGTLARAGLPEPLQPGDTIELLLDFEAKLPRVFARTGFALDAAGDPFFMVGQWFPKLGVWEEGAWNAYPFHANSEFYADFGTYEIAITVPADYVIGASGLPVSEEANSDSTKTVTYRAENVIDFAWAASPNFQTAEGEAAGAEVLYLYLPEHDWSVERAVFTTETALEAYSEWYGDYPYERLTVIDVPDSGGAAGGMEYPTLITSVSNVGGGRTVSRAYRALETVIAHEVGHQWWQSMVAFNEAEEPWLDEGFTDYSAARYFEVAVDESQVLDLGGFEVSYLEQRRFEYLANPRVPMYGNAWDFAFLDYAVGTYSKAALSLYTLEGVLGEETMLEVMSTFFKEYQFSHPDTEDFRRTAEEVSGEDLAWFFDGLVYDDAVVNYRIASLDANEVLIERVGEVEVPVDIRITFADGQTISESWDGGEESLTLSYPNSPEIRRAEIDPDREIKVDLNWSDNGMTRRINLIPWWSFTSRLIYYIQNFMLYLGGL